MVSRDGRVIAAFGVTGGPFQPIGQTRIISALLDRGLDIQAAIDEPRSFFRDGTLFLEPRLAGLGPALAEAGHSDRAGRTGGRRRARDHRRLGDRRADRRLGRTEGWLRHGALDGGGGQRSDDRGKEHRWTTHWPVTQRAGEAGARRASRCFASTA